MPTTTNVPQVKVNIMDEDTYDSITKSPTEFYAVTDATIKTSELDNDEGFITSSDIPVTDVQVNSTSVVTNKVANIPIAGANTLGTVKVGGYGLQVDSGGVLKTSPAVTTSITNKTSSWNPLTPDNIDLIIKSGLINNSQTLSSTDLASISSWLHYVTTDTQQTITAQKTFQTSTWNGGIKAKRTSSSGSFVVYENSDGVLGGIGMDGDNKPLCANANASTIRTLVRSGTHSDPSAGDSLTPVYVDSDGIAHVCSATIPTQASDLNAQPSGNYVLNPYIVTLANNASITLGNNTMYKADTLSAFSITTPVGQYPFNCEFDFSSGATPTTITYNGTIKWVDGSDDISQGVFVPTANKHYTVAIWWNNFEFVGTAKGV